MEGFIEGYEFFEKYSGTATATYSGDSYVSAVADSINVLQNDLNAFEGFKTDTSALKGDIAEFWHSDTFNINAIAKGSESRTFVNRSHGFASADISSNFDREFGLKYYKNGVESAKQQAKSIFERFKEYQASGGRDSLDDFLTKRGIDNLDDVLNDPIYNGQIRIIPKDQLEEATEWLRRKILEESVKRPDQVKRYQETLRFLNDKIKDEKGTESISLTRKEAEMLARLGKEGNVTEKTLADLGISTSDLIKYEYVIKQAFNAGITAATISMVLKTAPEIYKALSYLLETGSLDEGQFRSIGFAALEGSSEGFLRGSVSAAITSACKAGLWGETLTSISPSIVGAVTVITMDAMKNSYKVATGSMKTNELANELVKEMFVSACALAGGGITQCFIGVPVLGFLVGNFVGSVVGSFAYNAGYNTLLSFCVDTGFTMFGLVEQNYEVPANVMKAIGLDVFQYEEFSYEKLQPEKFKYDEFKIEEFRLPSLSIGFLRRGVIGVQRIGYVI